MELEEAIVDRLRQVIDPKTGADVVRMRLIEELKVDCETGHVSYRFRPSSPLCPLAVPLALSIRDAIAGVPGVTGQEVEVQVPGVNFVAGVIRLLWRGGGERT